jgi:hypothetical protein
MVKIYENDNETKCRTEENIMETREIERNYKVATKNFEINKKST